MKKLLIAAAVVLLSITGLQKVNAQINLSVNISSQPLWGPTGYNYVEYYYFPDINVYYYVPSAQYVYLQNKRWIWTYSLPYSYRNFDLYRAYKVVINANKPYLKNRQHVRAYSKYKNYGAKQAIIRDSRDIRYRAIQDHPNNLQNRPERDQNVRDNARPRNNRVVQPQPSRTQPNQPQLQGRPQNNTTPAPSRPNNTNKNNSTPVEKPSTNNSRPSRG